MRSRQGAEYWNHVAYRGPQHPVTRVFAREKLRVLEKLRRREGLGPLTELECRQALVLDLGAGPGIFTLPLTQYFGRVLAVDMHINMLARNPASWKVRGNGLCLPFGAATFHLVFVGNLLHHLDDPEGCLAECARVLRPDGALLSVEPNAFHPLMFAFGLAVREERRLLRYAPGYLARLAHKAGLTIVRRVITGQIFQNATPQWIVPLVLPFETRHYILGAYQLSVMRIR